MCRFSHTCTCKSAPVRTDATLLQKSDIRFSQECRLYKIAIHLKSITYTSVTANLLHYKATRQLSYRKEDRAMRPIYGCPEKF